MHLCSTFHRLPASQSAAEPAPAEPAAAEQTNAKFGQGGYVAPHKGLKTQKDTYLLMNPVYTTEYVLSVKPQHLPPVKLHQKARMLHMLL